MKLVGWQHQLCDNLSDPKFLPCLTSSLGDVSQKHQSYFPCSSFRIAIVDAPGILHHVTGRGISGTKIFRKDTDREDFFLGAFTLSRSPAITQFRYFLLRLDFPSNVINFSFRLVGSRMAGRPLRNQPNTNRCTST